MWEPFTLSGSCEWANAMVKSSAELKVLWANVALTHLRPLSTISSVPPTEVVNLRPTPTRLAGRSTHLGHTVPSEAHQDRTLASDCRRDSWGADFRGEIGSMPPTEVVNLRPTPTRLAGRTTHLGQTVPSEARRRQWQ